MHKKINMADILPDLDSVLTKTYNFGVKSLDQIDEDATQNKNFIINTPHKCYFMKIYTSGSLEERKFEANVLNKLEDQGFTFGMHVLPGSPLLVDNKPVMLFSAIEGSTLVTQQINLDDTLEIATNMAYMHNTLYGFTPGEKNRFNPLNFDFMNEFDLDLSDPIIKTAYDLLSKAFHSINLDQLRKTVIHDDLSPHNIMRNANGRLHFIDFDDSHFSFRVCDIGTVVKEFIFPLSGKLDQPTIDTFIKHYESVVNTPPLSNEEKRLIIPMALRRALFMYAYYRMTERIRNIYLQSNNEYVTISNIIAERNWQ